MSTTTHANERRYWRFLWVAVSLLALGLRWAYLTQMTVDYPLRGDAGQYVSYAWNLAHHGVFSKSTPGGANVVPDSFRDPGYPSLLAGVMLLQNDFVPWYHAVLMLQGLLGALTVALLMGAAHPWLGTKGSVLAGLVMAIWPHSITMSGYLLSETATAFWVALALFLLQRAAERNSRLTMAASGMAIGIAALTNAIMIPFGLLLAAALGWRSRSSRSLVLVLALSSLLLPLGWGVRNAGLHEGESSSGRALLNAVQGSWPEYHSSYIASAMGDPDGLRTQGEIQHEYDTLKASTSAGLQLVSIRVKQDPLRYVAWYAGKPALLWGWSIRIGQGNIYVYPTAHSLLDDQPALRATVSLCRALNPLIMLLALAGMVSVWMKGRQSPALPLAVTTLVAYVTLVYSLLQAEPRYSIPFRGMELLVAAEAVRQAILWWTSRRQSTRMAPHRQRPSDPQEHFETGVS
ncbi:ArnT family glycosyltransferase [Dyella telluris]|uniref:Glycosyltransferase family 39 protein n=1 Tax=Dyella telluris TaxID=2763498 RepID=A0A7G8Q0S1_9GAMM|nr:glycosyltransferase family 39 protein [Dyella telluris]QNK00379.1 glycosyltransferase family 39 protein [Dyella telluris]